MVKSSSERLNLEESNMISEAWKFYEDREGVRYNLQFSEVPWKFRKALMEAMKDWEQYTVGWHKNSGNQLFVFNKMFPNQEAWENWANSFPIQISEKRYWGNKEKVVIHGKKKK
jgi:hypothetical protein